MAVLLVLERLGPVLQVKQMCTVNLGNAFDYAPKSTFALVRILFWRELDLIS